MLKELLYFRVPLSHAISSTSPVIPSQFPFSTRQGTKLSTCTVIFLLSHRSEGQCGLPSFRVRHSKNSNQFTWGKGAHALRGKQDKLSKTLGICHLKDHVHRNSPINHIHVDIKLIQASERWFSNGPQGKDEAHGGERALTAGQSTHVIEGGFVPLSGLNL